MTLHFSYFSFLICFSIFLMPIYPLFSSPSLSSFPITSSLSPFSQFPPPLSPHTFSLNSLPSPLSPLSLSSHSLPSPYISSLAPPLCFFTFGLHHRFFFISRCACSLSILNSFLAVSLW